jgi:hypothetical protein
MFQNRLDPIWSLPCLSNKTTMSSTAITVAGVPAQVFLSNDVPQSRLSMRFLQTHIPRKSRSSVVELMITASLNLTSFTCILEFVLDPSLHLDAVLGLVWSRQCQNAEMLPLVLSLERFVPYFSLSYIFLCIINLSSHINKVAPLRSTECIGKGSELCRLSALSL